jgi:hypothetical protein
MATTVDLTGDDLTARKTPNFSTLFGTNEVLSRERIFRRKRSGRGKAPLVFPGARVSELTLNQGAHRKEEECGSKTF